MSLRDAVARKKQKQHKRGGYHEERSYNPTPAYPQDKLGLHETVQLLKEFVKY